MWGQCVVDVGSIRVVVGVGKNIKKMRRRRREA